MDPLHSGLACSNRKTLCVQLLLKDARVNPNVLNDVGFTPLYWAAYFGYLDVSKWWIASGREMDLGKPVNWKTDAIGVAKSAGKAKVVSLLEGFKKNPPKTRDEVRKELGITDWKAVHISRSGDRRRGTV